MPKSIAVVILLLKVAIATCQVTILSTKPGLKKSVTVELKVTSRFPDGNGWIKYSLNGKPLFNAFNSSENFRGLPGTSEIRTITISSRTKGYKCGSNTLHVEYWEENSIKISDPNDPDEIKPIMIGSDSKSVDIPDGTAPLIKSVTTPEVIKLDDNGIASLSLNQINYNVTDNCDYKVTASFPEQTLTCEDVGTKKFEVIFKDSDNNIARHLFSVNVVDAIKPIAKTKDITVYLGENGKVLINETEIDNGSLDNCSIEKYELNKKEFTCNDLGENSVELKVSDKSGQFDSRTAKVTVLDKVSPQMKTKNITVELDEDGQATILPNQVDDGSSDNCGLTLTLDKSTFSCMDAGEIEVTLTGVDASGNSASKKASVTVTGNGGLPTEVPVKSALLYLDEEGQASLVAEQVYDNSNIQNCLINDLSLSVDTFDCSQLGENEVTLTISNSKNELEGAATVEVLDTIKPKALVKELVLDLKGEKEVTITVDVIDNGSTDNCEIIKKEISLDTFSRVGVYPITYTVTDASNNKTTIPALVEVKDSSITDGVSIQHTPGGESIKLVYDNMPQRLAVYNMSGALVFKMYTIPQSLPVSHLRSGLYFFSFVTHSGEKSVLKVAVK